MIFVARNDHLPSSQQGPLPMLPTRNLERETRGIIPMKRQKPTLMLVDDEEDILRLLRYNLEKEGYAVVTAANGYEALERASRRLQWVVPVTLLIIYLLLYVNFRSAGESLLIMASLPFALVGSVWYLWLLDYHMSVAVAVGLIALAGVAAETGVVMLLYLDHAFAERVAAGAMRSRSDLDSAVEMGAVERRHE